MSVSKARRLLADAGREGDRLRRHLLVAAALREVFFREPVVVGGTAEEYWTSDEYHQTDLDLCVPVRRSDLKALRDLGFEKDGRHWFHEGVLVAVEIPESEIDGEMSRTVLEELGDGAARIIGIEDLYLDRLRQATMREDAQDVQFQSAVAVAVAGLESIDWHYVQQRIARTIEESPILGKSMSYVDGRVKRRVRRRL